MNLKAYNEALESAENLAAGYGQVAVVEYFPHDGSFVGQLLDSMVALNVFQNACAVTVAVIYPDRDPVIAPIVRDMVAGVAA